MKQSELKYSLIYALLMLFRYCTAANRLCHLVFTLVEGMRIG